MFIFGKKKRYSIGQKKIYFNSILSNPDSSLKKRECANLRLNQINNKQGDVFIVNDRLFGNPNSKVRQVVIAKKDLDNNKVFVLPVNKLKTVIPLSKFDNQRKIDFINKKNISINKLYELRGFKNTNNSYLTINEKNILKNKTNIYIR